MICLLTVSGRLRPWIITRVRMLSLAFCMTEINKNTFDVITLLKNVCRTIQLFDCLFTDQSLKYVYICQHWVLTTWSYTGNKNAVKNYINWHDSTIMIDDTHLQNPKGNAWHHHVDIRCSWMTIYVSSGYNDWKSICEIVGIGDHSYSSIKSSNSSDCHSLLSFSVARFLRVSCLHIQAN